MKVRTAIVAYAITAIAMGCGGRVGHGTAPEEPASLDARVGGESEEAASDAGDSDVATSCGTMTSMTSLSSGAGSCLPEALVQGPCGNAQCVIFETLPSCTQNDCDAAQAGLEEPTPDILVQVQNSLHQNWVVEGESGPDPARLPTCELTQLVASPSAPESCSDGLTETSGVYEYAVDAAGGDCTRAAEAGWCYVVGGATEAGACAQAVRWSASGAPVVGALITLACSESVCSP